MQNRYAGDVGDFGKFYLLRTLLGEKDRLGVVWYAYPDESHNNDGLHVGYLCNDGYQKLDEYLIKGLRAATEDLCERSIEKLEKQKLLPESTVYVSEVIPKKNREEWMDKALDKVSRCTLVFLDPDNGLEVKSISKNSSKSGKYVFYDEVVSFMESSSIEACIVYHHLGRNKSHKMQIQSRMKELKEKLEEKEITNLTIFAATFKPFSPRSFFIISTEKKSQIIEDKLKTVFEEERRLHNETKQKTKWDFDKMDSKGNFHIDFLNQT